VSREKERGWRRGGGGALFVPPGAKPSASEAIGSETDVSGRRRLERVQAYVSERTGLHVLATKVIFKFTKSTI
jgi:hypothetical protein